MSKRINKFTGFNDLSV